MKGFVAIRQEMLIQAGLNLSTVSQNILALPILLPKNSLHTEPRLDTFQESGLYGNGALPLSQVLILLSFVTGFFVSPAKHF